VKGARDLPPREVTALREALDWRDEVAREKDRAPFRVAQDQLLVEIAGQPPSDVEELSRLKGMNGRLAREAGSGLVERLRRVGQLPPEEWVGYPRPPRNGPGRPPPEVEELADRLKRVRNRRAEELGIERGALVPNATLLEIALAAPTSRDELLNVAGIKQWQVEAVGSGLLAELGGG
jgi:ribonuclease D